MIAKAQEEFGMEFTVGTEVEYQVLESPGSTEVLNGPGGKDGARHTEALPWFEPFHFSIPNESGRGGCA
jgi:hypothetical protein